MRLTLLYWRGAIVTLTFLVAAPALAAPPIRLATLAPKGTAFHQELLVMGEAWAKAPGGGARLIVYTDGSLGGEADMVRKMRLGVIQAAMLTVTGLSQIDDSVAALQNMPMMFRSTEELEYVREALAPQLEEKFRQKGFVVLFWGDAGWVRFFSREPGVYPEDFKKMKMFTWSGETKTADLWRAAGYRPIELEVTDILTGLNTKLIDAVCTEPYYALAGQFYSPAPYMLDVKWAPLVGGTVITEKAWDNYKPETQAAMLQAARASGIKLTRESRKRSDEAIEVMQRKHGLHVTAATPQIEQVWRQRSEEAYPNIRGTIVPADMFDTVQRLLAEYRKAHPSP